jgi:hypothetical protein
MTSPLLQAKIALAQLLGIERLKKERDTYRYERDIALSQRDGLLQQMAQSACIGPSDVALRCVGQSHQCPDGAAKRRVFRCR